MIEEIWLVLIVVALASLVRSAIGFGDALIAMPLLSSIISIKTASPLVAVTALFISVTIILTKGDFKVKSISKDYKLLDLIIACIIGIPIGIYLLRTVNEEYVKGFLGVVIILFAVFNLIKPELPRLKDERFVHFFGLISGMLGGAYNTNGPPIVIYSLFKKLKPEEFRVVIQYVLIPTNVFIIAGHGITGLWSEKVIELMLYSVPVSIFCVLIGVKLSKFIKQDLFYKIVNVFLVVIGIRMFF